VLECVVNVSEGRDAACVDTLARSAGDALLDVHRDPDHHRSVLTLGGSGVEEKVRVLARRAVELLDLSTHTGVHPRLGVLDVVPFVPLDTTGAPILTPSSDALREALDARDRFARWAADTLDLPCFLYGPERSLPDVRRHAFGALAPDVGPRHPHPTAGACAVGARGPLVAYNLWLDTDELAVAREIAREIRQPGIRTFGFAVQDATQVSCNLVDPGIIGPAEAFDAVSAAAVAHETGVRRAELVGLLPRAVLLGIPEGRWETLDLDPQRTVEARLGSFGN
jgi:glutamate formiminotransferase